jgi:hypothetical protein
MLSRRWSLMMTSLRKYSGTHKMGVNMYTYAVNMDTITSAMRRSPLMRRQREWSGGQDDSSEKYR